MFAIPSQNHVFTARSGFACPQAIGCVELVTCIRHRLGLVLSLGFLGRCDSRLPVVGRVTSCRDSYTLNLDGHAVH